MVYILLANGFEEAEALVPADLMRRAGVDVVLTSADENLAVTGAHGIQVVADRTISEVADRSRELVMLPGGLGGVEGISQSEGARALICTAHETGAWLAAICAAPTLLGEMGLLQGRKAVCYPGMEDGLTGGVPCPGTPVVVDGKLVTGEGPGSAFSFGLQLVECLKGTEAAKQVRDAVHYHG